MISWIADNATLLYLLLGVVAVALVLRWQTTRQAKYLIGVGLLAVLAGAVVILSLTVVTARQQLVQAVEETARQINAKNFDGAFRNFADKVFLDDAFEHRRVAGAVPSAFRVDDGDRTALADAQAVRLGPEDATAFRQAELLQPAFEKIPRRETAFFLTAFRFRLIAAEKNVPPRDRHADARCNVCQITHLM